MIVDSGAGELRVFDTDRVVDTLVIGEDNLTDRRIGGQADTFRIGVPVIPVQSNPAGQDVEISQIMFFNRVLSVLELQNLREISRVLHEEINGILF